MKIMKLSSVKHYLTSYKTFLQWLITRRDVLIRTGLKMIGVERAIRATEMSNKYLIPGINDERHQHKEEISGKSDLLHYDKL